MSQGITTGLALSGCDSRSARTARQPFDSKGFFWNQPTEGRTIEGSMANPPPLMLGRYALFEEIARGGMAAVHLARLIGPVGFSRTVAIKRMHPHCATDPEFAQMFLEEARMAARIRHPNVVPTLDVVALDSEILLVMELVQGATLALLNRTTHLAGEAMPLPVLSNIITGTLLGLHAAHEIVDEQDQPLHLVHRDVSPQNILVGTDGVPRVLDFGVAKAVGNLSHTRDGALKGKLRYMAPEQVRGENVTRQADLWAVGVVLWEALTQERMLPANSDAEAILRVLNDPLAPPVRPRGEPVPPALEAVVMRALARDCSQRFGTALEMANALREAVRPADQSDVGSWVTRIAGESVRTRATRLREIEAISSAGLYVDVGTDSGISSGRLSQLGSGRIVPPPPASGSVTGTGSGVFTGTGARLSGEVLTGTGTATAFGPDAAPTSAAHPPTRSSTAAVVGGGAVLVLGLLAALGVAVMVGHADGAASVTAAASATPASAEQPAVSAAAAETVPAEPAASATAEATASAAPPPAITTALTITTTTTTTAVPVVTAAPPRGNRSRPKPTGKPGTGDGDLYGQH
jgi:eukaryotic-like serine/threonine-protein kinase